jgi:hypothetical protein
MKFRFVVGLALACSLVGVGCKKDSTSSASNLPAKGPWEAAKITFVKTGADGSPTFKIENTGGKTIKVLFLDFYGYDAKGNQVAHNELSYNIEIKGGSSRETDTKSAKDAVTWEGTYHGIELEGDKLVTDPKRAPAKKPKGS